MGIIEGMISGFIVVFTPFHLFLVLIGALLGTLVGILPGLGASGAIAILLPVSIGMNPVSGMIMLSAMYCGARYGGAITAILLNLPGESSAVVTCLDGYQLSLQGRAGPALGLAAFSSFVGGTVSAFGLVLLAPVLSRMASKFGPPEYCSLTLLGLSLITALTGKSLLKGLLATTFGLAIATVGSDIFSGQLRLTFGILEFMDGINFIAVAVGLFALGEILLNIEQGMKMTIAEVPKGFLNLLPSREDVMRCIPTWIRSTILGFFVGVLPGTGATVASFLSYTVAKTIAKNPERFGNGAVEGLAAAESADNASASGSLVPMLTLGIPGSGGTAMLMLVLLFQGVRPGPLLIVEHPDLFWGIVGSIYVGNVMLLIINLPLIPIMVQFLKVPYYLMYIIIIILGSVGVYSFDFSLFDLLIMGSFGVIGYAFKKLDYPAAALVLALILCPMIERSLKQSLLMSNGSLLILIQRPISFVFLSLAVIALFTPLLRSLLGKSSNSQL